MRILFFMLLFPVFCWAQVGQSEPVESSVVIGVADRGVGLPKLEKVESDNLYILTFINLEYPRMKQVESMAFYASNDELDYFYNFLKDQAKNKETQSLVLGDAKIFAHKVMGSVKVSVHHNDGWDSWFYLSKRQIDRLFNR